MLKRKERLAALLLAAAVCVQGVSAGSVTAYAEEMAAQGMELQGEGREADADGFDIRQGNLNNNDLTLYGYTGDAKEVVIPDGVGTIIQSAFSGSNVTSITFPASVRMIYHYVGIPGDFRGCNNLEEVNVVSENPYLASEDGVLYNKDKTQLLYYPIKKSCVLNIAANVEYISAYEISGRGGLKSVNLDAANPNFAYEDGILTNKDKTSLIGYVPEPSGSIDIPESVTGIEYGALSNCRKLTSVTIPEGVTDIAYNAFSSCENLASVVIPESVTKIGYSAFEGCGKLTIYGKAGSYAETFAKDNKIPFSTGKPAQPTVPVAKTAQTLKLTKSYSKAYGNKPFRLNARLSKGNGKLSYVSSDKKIAAVSKSGTVTIKGTGVAAITVTAAETAQYKKTSAKVLVKVSPAQMGIKSAKALAGRKIKVSWKRDAKATGYEILYSTDKKFKNKKMTKSAMVKNNKATSTTLKKLTKGKKYYVKIRAYKNAKINGKAQKLYGPWSGVKKSGTIKR